MREKWQIGRSTDLDRAWKVWWRDSAWRDSRLCIFRWGAVSNMYELVRWEPGTAKEIIGVYPTLRAAKVAHEIREALAR